jgi:hypothetical protein
VLLAHRIMGAPQEEPHHQYFTEDVTGDTFQCDTAVYTVTSGTVRTVVHEGPALPATRTSPSPSRRKTWWRSTRRAVLDLGTVRAPTDRIPMASLITSSLRGKRVR